MEKTRTLNKSIQFEITETDLIDLNNVKHSQTILNYEKDMFVNKKHYVHFFNLFLYTIIIYLIS